MFSGKSIVIGALLLAGVPGNATLLAQTTSATPAISPATEFPVLMRQKVEAGKTPVGTKIKAKLTVATLVNGVVIPEDAVLSGEVIESAPRSSQDPSRLAVALDSAEWKDGPARGSVTLATKIYLTAWYYPLAILPSEPSDVMSGSLGSHTQHPGGAAPYPNPNTRDSPSYPRGNTDASNNPAPEKPLARISPHRELLKNVESTNGAEGILTLTSTHSNIKLDKSTTYVFAAGDLGAGTGSAKP